ncbi:MAG TPA: tyrosine-type recombinase/integrase [Thermomicrobiales bacterium]|jgi:integrase
MAGRRGNGEGSIYQRADGTWRAQALLNGKRHGVSAKTRREAQTKLRQLLGEAERGILPPAEKITLNDHIERWLETVVRHSVRPRTLKSYRDLTRLYILPTLGARKLVQLQPADVQRLYSVLLDRGLAPKTVRNVHAALRRSLKQAVDWNLTPRNVATLVEAPRIKREEVVALTAQQAQVLLTIARGGRWEALITIALTTGMRIGEVLGLRWGDVDLAIGSLRVQRQIGQDGVFSEPKTAKGRRTIDLPASSVVTLKEHRRQQTEARLLAGPAWHHDDLLFCTHAGKPLSQRNVLRAFKTLLTQGDLPDVPFHALRHTHATLLLSQGIHPKVVQERLGHATIAMTLDIYSAYVPSMGRDAADKLDALLA